MALKYHIWQCFQKCVLRHISDTLVCHQLDLKQYLTLAIYGLINYIIGINKFVIF